MSQFIVKKFSTDIQNENHGNYGTEPTNCINVLLIGRSQTGKSTIVKTLMNPNTSNRSTLFSENRDPECVHLLLIDKSKNTTSRLNIIDTPGLKEFRENSGTDRSNEDLLKFILKFVEQHITLLNIVCFVSRAGHTHRLDTNVFNEVQNFLGPKYSAISMLVLTHCDEFPDSKLDQIEADIRTHEVAKPLFDYCKLGIRLLGALNQDKVDSFETGVREIIVETISKRVENMRERFLQQISTRTDTAMNTTQLHKTSVRSQNQRLNAEREETQSIFSIFCCC